MKKAARGRLVVEGSIFVFPGECERRDIAAFTDYYYYNNTERDSTRYIIARVLGWRDRDGGTERKYYERRRAKKEGKKKPPPEYFLYN